MQAQAMLPGCATSRIRCHCASYTAIAVALRRVDGLTRHPAGTGAHGGCQCYLMQGVRDVSSRASLEQASAAAAGGAPAAGPKVEQLMPQQQQHGVYLSGRQIVLAIDNQPESEMSVVWAVHNLLRPGDCVHIYHVVPNTIPQHIFSPPSMLSHVVRVDTSGAHEEAEKHMHDSGVKMAREIIGRYGPRLARMQVQLQAHVVPVTGPGGKQVVGHVLCEQASSLGASAVVLASRSQGGLSELLHGSVADYVVKHASCPVAVLHMTAPRRAPSSPTTSTTQELSHMPGQHRHLVVAVDNTQDSLATCQWILDNMYHTGDTVHLVHVVPCLPLHLSVSGSDFLMHPGIQAEASMLASEQEMAGMEAEEWKARQAKPFMELFDKAGASYTFDVMVHYTEDPVMAIAGSLASKAAELSAAAVVVCHHRQPALAELLLGSVSSQVAHHCTRPVVVLHGNNMRAVTTSHEQGRSGGFP